MSAPRNLHGTAIVLGATGILITGPSGAGKSALALSLLAAAQRDGLFAALIADDQVIITICNGRVLASAPPSIAGLMEIRGTGIVERDHLAEAVIDFALLPVDPAKAERLPDPSETLAVSDGHGVPLVRLRFPDADPFAALCALCPGLAQGIAATPRFAER